MGTCDMQRLTFIFEPKSWLGESEGCWSTPNLSPAPQGPLPTPRPDLRLWGEACLDPGPSWGCLPLGWLLYSSHCLPRSLSVGSNTWNQASALENVPALTSWITVWTLQGLVYSFSDPSVMTYLWRTYQALTRCRVPLGVLRVERISVHFNRFVVSVCDGSDLSEAIFMTPGLGARLSQLSLITVSSATSTRTRVLQLLCK